MFESVKPKQNFPEMEEKILKFWGEEGIFGKSLKRTKDQKSFVFYEGPPFANGKPGIHHILARAFKDIIARYKTMRGFYVERKAGWDTHGLPTEIEAEKRLGIKTKKDIERIGIEKFIKTCQRSVFLYKDEWEKITKRMGYWVDLENAYMTCSQDYIESVWWILKQIWERKLLYQDYKVVPYCPRCGTSLSSHEVAQGYKRVSETSIYVKFKVKSQSNTYILSWTTTPWTLPGNVALAIGKNFDYVKIKVKSNKSEEYLILTKDRLKVVENDYKIVERFKGKDLVDLEYEPLYSYVSLKGKKAYFVAEADFVSTEEGTGIVHIAPMYGEDDYNLGEQVGLPKIHTVDEQGRFKKEVKPWAGKFVKDAEKDIIKNLEQRKLLYSTELYTHDYPFCWRCGAPLLYYAKLSWFIKVTAVRDQLVKNNEKINWVPSYIKEGRFGEWLREVKDWAISRERYWGTPIPIWKCEKCNNIKVIGSFKELEKEGRKKLSRDFDPHRPYIDKIKLECECGGKMHRILEVLDCWFDSGSMPFAEWHYPFENKDRVDSGKAYPADFISEAIDQTRGWFYTLLAISTLLKRGPSFLNVICLGLILDEKGQKMSKSKGNVVDPWNIINKYGIDSLRWYLYTVNQPGVYKRFREKDLQKVLRKFLLTLWNTYSFFVTYANANKWEGDIRYQISDLENILDKWIISELNLLMENVVEKLEILDVTGAGRDIEIFIDSLSNWYVRRSRERFRVEVKKDQNAAFSTLHYVLINLAKLLAPFIPFVSEEIYQNLTGEESVHLADYPKPDKKLIDEELSKKMIWIRQIVTEALSERAAKGIKVRQPLSKFKIRGKKLEDDLIKLIKDETNVKGIELKIDSKLNKVEYIKGSLCTQLTKELKLEGIVREIVRQVQEMRKKAKYNVRDIIDINYKVKDNQSKVRKVFDDYSRDLKRDLLVKNLVKGRNKDVDVEQEIDINGEKVWVGVKKIEKY